MSDEEDDIDEIVEMLQKPAEGPTEAVHGKLEPVYVENRTVALMCMEMVTLVTQNRLVLDDVNFWERIKSIALGGHASEVEIEQIEEFYIKNDLYRRYWHG